MYQSTLNIQSFWRHIKVKHYWFCRKYVKHYENQLNKDKEIDLDENFNNRNVFNDNDMEPFEREGQYADHIENISFADFDHNQLIACFLLELRQKYGTVTEASCFISTKSITYFTVGE